MTRRYGEQNNIKNILDVPFLWLVLRDKTNQYVT